MAKSFSNTSLAARTGNRRSRRASLPPIQTTAKPVAATSASRVTTTARSHFATFAYEFCHERTHASLCDDVPPILHLGGVVRDHGHLPWSNASLHRSTDRTRLRRDSDCSSCLAVFHGGRRRSLLLE